MNRRYWNCWPVLLASLLLADHANAEALSGLLAQDEAVALGVLESGIVAEVDARAGQRVEQGASLLHLDPRDFEARLAAARARLHDVSARHAEARRELKRARELYERTLLSDHERQVAANDEAFARARRDAARAELKLAELALERSRLRAPFAGVVVRVLARAGMAVRNDLRIEPLLYLLDDRALRVELTVSAERRAALPVGRELVLRIAGQRVKGRVVGSGPLPSSSAGGRYYRVVIAPQDLPADAHAGQAVRVELD